MDRALRDVKDTAAQVIKQPTEWSRLSNIELAQEVQKFNGYNHFARSGSNLLDEVVARLVAPHQSRELPTPLPVGSNPTESLLWDKRPGVVITLGVTQMPKDLNRVILVEAMKNYLRNQEAEVTSEKMLAPTWIRALAAIQGRMSNTDILNLRGGALVEFCFVIGYTPSETGMVDCSLTWKIGGMCRTINQAIPEGDLFALGQVPPPVPSPNPNTYHIPKVTGFDVIWPEGHTTRVVLGLGNEEKVVKTYQRLRGALAAAGFGNPDKVVANFQGRYNMTDIKRNGERHTHVFALYVHENGSLYWQWEPSSTLDMKN